MRAQLSLCAPVCSSTRTPFLLINSLVISLLSSSSWKFISWKATWARGLSPTAGLVPRVRHSAVAAWLQSPAGSWNRASSRCRLRPCKIKIRSWDKDLGGSSSSEGRRNWQPTPVFLPWESCGPRSLWAAVHSVAQSRTRLKRLSMHACLGEGNGSSLQCSCLENPRDGGAWWAAVYGVAQSRTRLKWLSSSNSSKHQKGNVMVWIVTPHSYIKVLTSNTSECNYYGDRAFKEIVKVKMKSHSWARGVPGGSVVKNPPPSAGEARDVGLISGSGRSSGGGNGSPLQNSRLEDPTDRGAWRATVLGVTESWTWFSDWRTTIPVWLGLSKKRRRGQKHTQEKDHVKT